MTALVALTFGSSGCGGCNDHSPFVPFSIEPSSPKAPQVAPSPETSTSEGARFSPVSGRPPEGGGSAWNLGGGAVKAPDGLVFRHGVVVEGTLFAWVSNSQGGAATFVFANDGATTPLTTLDKSIDLKRCSARLEVAQIGRRTALASAKYQCDQTEGVAYFVAHKEGASGVFRLDLNLETPLSGAVQTFDRDGDGGEDLDVSVTSTESSDLSAKVVLLERPTGFLWDAAEPSASLGALGQGLLNRAIAKKADVAARAGQLTRFASALCSSRGAKITSFSGTPACLDTRVFADALHATAIVASQKEDWPKTVGALDAIVSLKQHGGRQKQVESLFAKKVKRETAHATLLAVKPRSGARSPFEWGGDGELFVSAEDRVVRVDPATFEESVALDRSPISTELSFATSDGPAVISSLVGTCQPNALTLVGTARSASVKSSIPALSSDIPIAAFSEKCEPGPRPMTVLRAEERAAWVAIAGETYRVTFEDQGLTVTPANFAQGSPSLPFVVGLGRSILVLTEAGTARWVGPETEGLSRCLTGSGHTVACVDRQGRAVLLTGAPSKTKSRP